MNRSLSLTKLRRSCCGALKNRITSAILPTHLKQRWQLCDVTTARLATSPAPGMTFSSKDMKNLLKGRGSSWQRLSTASSYGGRLTKTRAREHHRTG